MEPIDAAFERFSKFVDEVVPTYWDTILTEADARMKIIDKVFVSVLGWPDREIYLEDAAGEGRIDYRFAIGGLNRMIWAAHREGSLSRL